MFLQENHEPNMLTSVELFAGLGGITRALRGFVSPLVYCEDDPVCRATLDARIAAGDIDDAAVLSDFRDTRLMVGALAGVAVDLVTVGAACSSMTLMADVMAFVETVSPPMVFLQNVGKIVTTDRGGDHRKIVRMFTRLGYRVTWCVLSARHVGALHGARTWFALAYKQRTLRGKSITSAATVVRFSWSGRVQPPRKKLLGQKICDRETDVRFDDRRRLRMLSMSVVPDCTRLGFVYLFSGGRVTDIRARTLRHVQFEASSRGDAMHFGISSSTSGSHDPYAHARGALLAVTGGRRSRRSRRSEVTRLHADANPRFVEFVMGYPKNWSSMRMPIAHDRERS